MTNMSYCRFQNTFTDFRDCRKALERIIDGKDEVLQRIELQYATHLAVEALKFLQMIYEANAVDFDDLEEHNLVVLVEAVNERRRQK